MEFTWTALEYEAEESFLEIYRIMLFLFLKPIEISFSTVFLYHLIIITFLYLFLKYIYCIEDRRYFQRLIHESVHHHFLHVRQEFQEILNAKNNQSIWPIYLQSIKRLHLLSALLKRNQQELDSLRRHSSVKAA